MKPGGVRPLQCVPLSCTLAITCHLKLPTLSTSTASDLNAHSLAVPARTEGLFFFSFPYMQFIVYNSVLHTKSYRVPQKDYNGSQLLLFVFLSELKGKKKREKEMAGERKNIKLKEEEEGKGGGEMGTQTDGQIGGTKDKVWQIEIFAAM